MKNRVSFTMEQQAKVDSLIGAAYTKAFSKARGHYAGKVAELKEENAGLKAELEGRKTKKLFSWLRR